MVIKRNDNVVRRECGMVKCPREIGWKANARPPGWKVRENAPLLPRGMGTAGID